jgi:hypothetical protein
MAAAMKLNPPATPECCRTKAITKAGEDRRKSAPPTNEADGLRGCPSERAPADIGPTRRRRL